MNDMATKRAKVSNNLDFGSTHIVGPWDPKYPQQFEAIAQTCELGT
jgi:hypothetical protein